MLSLFASKFNTVKENFVSLFDKYFVSGLCKVVLFSGIVLYLASIFLFKDPNCSPSEFLETSSSRLTNPNPNSSISHFISSNDTNPTNLSHLVFGLLGSEKAWHYRKSYIESWWRPKITRGYLFLDEKPKWNLLPWSKNSPPYRISDDITKLVQETQHVAPIMARMVHGIMELFREEHEGVRWVVMGDDDSIFFVENMVDVLAQYDHTQYYYFGGQSEYILSNFWYSFSQGFGGAGFILSYPLAKALAEDMESCLRRYPFLRSADQITMACIVDLGVSFSPLKGLHQIDLHGDISGLLSSHPKVPLMSLHHFDAIAPIFPSMDRIQSTKQLMKAAKFDQSRMLQQTICYHKPSNWSFSISFGYSVHIYEKIMPRSYLQYPIETFEAWNNKPQNPPYYMFNTRPSAKDSCETPHVFFLKSIGETWNKNEIWATYSRSAVRRLPGCPIGGNHPANYVNRIQVYSPRTKRTRIDRCECCDVIHTTGSNKAKVKFRECFNKEKIA
ncbi:uncharacterized protein LOC107798227 [Nicotiana tabacum]|uniref:Uncharacterized protein LOC107798227 n=1 Tax=Nicotiana tabacum TaxID=4097 RepID=A0A1S4AJ60_TOBAC|nr:uncharacterized protein LOC104098691 [Nicotiana tomentosiformis]XP_016476686.1 PREDICTED: uncharacterized protein LOC107798227 [Nicotiana tabacum]